MREVMARGYRGDTPEGLRDRRGVALMMVLWVLVFLGIIGMNFFVSGRWNMASTRNLKEETASYYLAVSGYHEALHYLMSDKDPAIDFLDEEGNYWIDGTTEAVTGKRTTGEGEVEIRISDENGRININYADDDRLRKLFERAGVSQDDITGIIDSIKDWKDPDSEHHLSGAEDEYYEGLESPYKAKNALFDVPEELVLVKGMKREYLMGSEEGNALLPLLTTFGKNVININTVPREVMEMLGMNEFEIEAVLKQRTRESGGFRFIPQQFAQYGLNAVSSENLRIEVIAAARNSGLVSRVVAVVSRKQGLKGLEVRPIFWRESVENTRI